MMMMKWEMSLVLVVRIVVVFVMSIVVVVVVVVVFVVVVVVVVVSVVFVVSVVSVALSPPRMCVSVCDTVRAWCRVKLVVRAHLVLR